MSAFDGNVVKFDGTYLALGFAGIETSTSLNCVVELGIPPGEEPTAHYELRAQLIEKGIHNSQGLNA